MSYKKAIEEDISKINMEISRLTSIIMTMDDDTPDEVREKLKFYTDLRSQLMRDSNYESDKKFEKVSTVVKAVSPSFGIVATIVGTMVWEERGHIWEWATKTVIGRLIAK